MQGVDQMTFQYAFSNLHPIAYIILFITTAVFIIAVTAIFILRSQYKKILADLERPRGGKFRSDFLNDIVSDYESTALGSREVNTQAIIEKHFETSLGPMQVAERFLRNSISTLIALGLLGTFVGLTLAVGELISMMMGIDSDQIIEMFRTLGVSLLTSLRGMSTAFTTSLFGIAFSIILTVLNVIFNVEECRENLMVHIEEYLDNTVSLIISRDKESEYEVRNRILRDTFTEFGKKIENSLVAMTDSLGEKLKNAVMEVTLSSKALDNTVEKFDRSLKNFAENIRDFTEFNVNLRNNIEIMDVSFIKVTEALKNSSKILLDNFNSMEAFSKDVQIAVNELNAQNKKVVEDMETLVGKVREATVSIKEFGQMLKDEMSQREGDMQKYRENFTSLMAGISKEISLLGEQVSKSFDRSLSDTVKTVSQELSREINAILKEIYDILESFGENEKIMSRTISSLPDQFLTYSETASARVDNKMNEIIKLIQKDL